MEFEAAARQMKTEAQIRRVMSDLYQRVSGSPLPSGSVKAFFESWSRRKAVENAERTADKYRDASEKFLAHLGERSALDLGYLTSADVVSFRDALLARVSATTVNQTLKILRIALNQARREGLIQTNPAPQVANLKRAKGDPGRRAFSLPELKQILAVANEEWRGMIAFGVYTGQRLSDVALLSWSNIDPEKKEIRLTTGKTGRRMEIPLAQPLVDYLCGLRTPDDPKAPLSQRPMRQSSNRDGPLFFPISSTKFWSPQVLRVRGLTRKNPTVTDGEEDVSRAS
jgi:integrase